MADKKITQLTETTTLSGDDVFPVATDTGTTPATKKVKASTAGNYIVAGENLLLNGGAWFFQRVNPSTATAMTDDVYNAPDCWYSLVQGSGATIARNAGIGTSKYSFKLVAGGTTNRYGIAQITQSADSLPMRGKTVTAQCLIKPVNNAGSGSRNYRIAVLEWTGTADSVTSEIVNSWTSATYTTGNFFTSTTLTLVGTATVSATHNTETTLSVTGTVSSSCNNLITFIWAQDVPTHASDYALIGEVGLRKALGVVQWNPRKYGDELALCQQFCEKSYDIDTAPATATVAAGNGSNVAVLTLYILGFPFKVPKFATPTVSLWSYNGTINKVSLFDTGSDIGTAATASGIGQSGVFYITDGGSPYTVGKGYSWHWLAKYEL